VIIDTLQINLLKLFHLIYRFPLIRK